MHVCFSEPDDPSVVHSSPPCCGAGLSHARVLSISPPPQVTGHCDHVLHSPQPPLTTHKIRYCTQTQTYIIIEENVFSTFYRFLEWQLPGHGFSLHFSTSVLLEPSTVQSLPPCAGAGLSHVRTLLRSPPPHETGQSVHSANCPHTPLTVKKAFLISNLGW